MLFDFKVTTTHAVIFSIKLSTLELIKKKDLNLADGIRKTKFEVDYGRKSDFDYFRYIPPQNEDSDSDSELQAAKQDVKREKTRRKFRREFMRITYGIREGRIDYPAAMEALNLIQEKFKVKRDKLDELYE